jgi:hypothetical protein
MTTGARTQPLGVNPDVALDERQLRTLQVLESFDLTPVRQRLLRDTIMPSGWVDEAILEFRRYLGLRVICPGPIDMFSKPVDNVWHTCLLHSRLYAALCESAFGQFVHHEPAGGHGPGPEDAATPSRPDAGTRWRLFEDAYTRMYGPVGRLWRRPGQRG